METKDNNNNDNDNDDDDYIDYTINNELSFLSNKDYIDILTHEIDISSNNENQNQDENNNEYQNQNGNENDILSMNFTEDEIIESISTILEITNIDFIEKILLSNESNITNTINTTNNLFFNNTTIIKENNSKSIFSKGSTFIEFPCHSLEYTKIKNYNLPSVIPEECNLIFFDKNYSINNCKNIVYTSNGKIYSFLLFMLKNTLIDNFLIPVKDVIDCDTYKDFLKSFKNFQQPDFEIYYYKYNFEFTLIKFEDKPIYFNNRNYEIELYKHVPKNRIYISVGIIFNELYKEIDINKIQKQDNIIISTVKDKLDNIIINDKSKSSNSNSNSISNGNGNSNSINNNHQLKNGLKNSLNKTISKNKSSNSNSSNSNSRISSNKKGILNRKINNLSKFDKYVLSSNSSKNHKPIESYFLKRKFNKNLSL